jgi:hypothetical protein
VSFVWQGLGNIGFWPSRVAHGGACESLQCVRIVRRERGPQRPQTDLELPLKKRGWASGTGRYLSSAARASGWPYLATAFRRPVSPSPAP